MKSRLQSCSARPIRIIGCFLLSACLNAKAAENPDNVFLEVSTDVETSHFKWAKPYSRGTCRVLVIAPAWGHRETVELMQRFDMQCEPLMTPTHTKLSGRYYGEVQYLSPEKVAKQFDKALAKDFDVIVIGAFHWNKLLIEHRYQILKKVHDGTGLVYVAPPPKRDELKQLFSKGILNTQQKNSLLTGIPWSELSLLKGKKPEDIVKAGIFGKGRWVTLDYKTCTTNQCLTASSMPCKNPWEYEYYQSIVGRAVYWAAGKEAPVLFSSGEMLTSRMMLPSDVKIIVDAVSHQASVTLITSIHELSTGRFLPGSERNISLTEGMQEVTFTVGRLSAGRYMINLAIRDANKRVLGWSSFPATITHGCTVSELSVDKEAYDAGDTIRGKIAVSRPLEKGEQLNIQFLDNHGRLLREDIKKNGRSWDMEYSGIRPLGTNIHYLKAVLTDSHGDAFSRSIEFSIRGMKRPAFHLAIWEEPQTDYISSLWYKRFKELGVHGIFYNVGREDFRDASHLIAKADLFGVPMFKAYHTKSQETDIGPVHEQCLHDPEYLKEVKDKNTDIAQAWGRYDTLYYTDGSDKVLRGVCFSPHTLTAFRTYLQNKYGKLNKLNETWGTTFSSWDTVIPDTLEKAKKRNHFVSWIEHVRFMETAFVSHDAFMDATLRSADPDALMGHDGYGRLNSVDGADWWKLLQVNTYYNLYTYQDPPQLEITRSIADRFPNVKERSIYYGSYTQHFANYPYLRLLPWYSLLHNYTGLFWWSSTGKVTYSSHCGYMAGPDFRPTKSHLASWNPMKEINAGIMQFISQAKRRHDGIAIYYDQTAVHALTAFKHPSFMVGAYSAFQAIIEDLGMQYEYLTPQLIDGGILQKEGFRVLILAQTLAMPRKTAETIASFVQSGGMVIADTMPALYDYYLRPAKKGSLLSSVMTAPGTINKAGNGTAFLWKEKITQYQTERHQKKGAAMREQFAQLMDTAGVSRFATLDPPKNDPGFPELEVITYRDGEAYYIGMLNNRRTEPGKDCVASVSTTFKVPREFHMYNMRTKTYLGHTAERGIDIIEGDATLLALLPCKIGNVTIQRGGTKAERETPYGFSVHTANDPAAACRQAFNITISDPDGRLRPEYCNVIVNSGSKAAEGIIPFALNDPTGMWTLRATDAISNSSAEVTVELR